MSRLFGVIPLVKEIVSRAGKVHFRRWAIFESRWFSIYVHNIARSDNEADPHDHPWGFLTVVLRRGYSERVWNEKHGVREYVRRPGTFAYHPTTDFHKITLLGADSWSLVFTGPRTHDLWGFATEAGWVDHVTYRQKKHPTGV